MRTSPDLPRVAAPRAPRRIHGLPLRGATVLLALFASLSGPRLLDAQSLLGTEGLGFPVEALDARARALGSVGVGLMGTSLLPTDPASASGILFPTAELTLQPHWGEGSMDERELTARGTRFPLMAIGYPVASVGGVATLTIGSFLDQRWELTRETTVVLEGTPTQVTDAFSSDGGVAVVRVGWAQRLGERVGVAAGLGRYTGSVTRVFSRTFDSLPGVQVPPRYEEGGRWGYEGVTASLGALWDPAPFLRFSGALEWSSDLEADPTRETEGSPASYDLPLQLRFGASGELTPDLDMTLGFTWGNWESSGGGLQPETVAGTVWSFGGGLEWVGLTRGFKSFPLRVGYRHSDLPFRFGGEAPTESLFSGGIGLDLFRAENVTLGGFDLAVERGSRKAGSFTEDFWRGTLTVKIAGF